MNFQTNTDIIDGLRKLRLLYAAENLEDLVNSNEGRSTLDFMKHWVTLELTEKRARTLQRRMTEAKLGRYARMDNFDWNWPSGISKGTIQSHLKLEFVTEPKNLIFLGTAGLGKTMIAKNIAATAVMRGLRSRFVTASKLASTLVHSGHKIEVAIRKFTEPDILVIDELGYLSFEQKAADALFEVISRRYELKPIIVTSNLPFSEWPTIFPGASCVTALVDRLTHHADIIKISGKSYRKGMKEKRR